MSAAQKKVIDDHCTNEWALKVAAPVGRLRACRHRQDQGRSRPRGLSSSRPTQLAEWHKAAEPLDKTWADNVKKAGGDPDAAMKELQARSLAKYERDLLT